MIHDEVTAVGHADDYQPVMARIGQFSHVGVAAGTLLGAGLLRVDVGIVALGWLTVAAHAGSIAGVLLLPDAGWVASDGHEAGLPPDAAVRGGADARSDPRRREFGGRRRHERDGRIRRVVADVATGRERRPPYATHRSAGGRRRPAGGSVPARRVRAAARPRTGRRRLSGADHRVRRVGRAPRRRRGRGPPDRTSVAATLGFALVAGRRGRDRRAS